MADELAPVMAETTQAQVIVSGSVELATNLPKTYASYRIMRKNPTLGLARALSVAPVIAAEWSIEADDDVDDERVKFIQSQIMPLREPLVETAMYGGVDFGWQPFEKVFEPFEGRVILKRVKALLHDITTILVDKVTGAFAGYVQEANEGPLTVPLANCLLIPFRVEGTQWHGESLMENARLTYNQWTATNANADKYDRKIAGANWVVYYPLGTSLNSQGDDVPNIELARTILTALEGTGSIIVPSVVAAFIDDVNKEASDKYAWRIELLADPSPKQYSFGNRLQYLDVQLVRALLIPERAILEGRFGTKAEAGAHADIALKHMELIHRHITRYVNWYVVDQLMSLNYGPETRGTVRLVASPLADEKLAYLREIYITVLKNPAGFQSEWAQLDTDALKDKLGIPKSAELTGMDDGDDNDDDNPNLPVSSDDEVIASVYAKQV